jgi:hypothetical protein
VIVKISCESLIKSDAEAAKGLLPVGQVQEEALSIIPAFCLPASFRGTQRFGKSCFNRFRCGHIYSAGARAGASS